MRIIRVRDFLTLTGLTLAAFAYLTNPATAQTLQGGQLFGDWVVHCETQHVDGVNCKMSQTAVVESTSETLLRINIRYQPKTQSKQIQFVLPLGVSLRSTPKLSLDQRPAGDVKLDMCLADGCYSSFDLNADLLERFLSMHNGTLLLRAGNGEPVKLPISGNGSRLAFNSMLAMAKALAQRNVE